jgi:hypothetical protein
MVYIVVRTTPASVSPLTFYEETQVVKEGAHALKNTLWSCLDQYEIRSLSPLVFAAVSKADGEVKYIAYPRPKGYPNFTSRYAQVN